MAGGARSAKSKPPCSCDIPTLVGGRSRRIRDSSGYIASNSCGDTGRGYVSVAPPLLSVVDADAGRRLPGLRAGRWVHRAFLRGFLPSDLFSVASAISFDCSEEYM